MKKILAIILVCTFVFGLTACTGDTHISVNAENTDQLTGGKFGKSALVEIGDGLYYDSTTRIVYWWNGSYSNNSYSATAPSPYYAPNGLPYRYNPETNTFEEIEYDRG
jgi:hypothetical protein